MAAVLGIFDPVTYVWKHNAIATRLPWPLVDRRLALCDMLTLHDVWTVTRQHSVNICVVEAIFFKISSALRKKN